MEIAVASNGNVFISDFLGTIWVVDKGQIQRYAGGNDPNGSNENDDRPALIFVQQGTIEEYASNCSVPIVHKAGEIRPEVNGTSHWWKNTGTETVILYVGDVRRDPADHNT